MAETLQLFKIVRQLLATVGIHPPPPPLQQLSSSESIRFVPFNWRNLTFMLSSLTMSTSTFAFFLFEAETIQDLGTSFYTTMSELAVALGFFSFVLEMRNAFEIIDKIDAIIRKSMELVFKLIKLMIEFRSFSHSNRTEQSHFQDHVPRCERKNWKSIWNNVLHTGEIRCAWTLCAGFDCSHGQLLHSGNGREVIPSTFTSRVSKSADETMFGVKNTKTIQP